MEKTIGNYLGQSNRSFPLDCETLEYIAGNGVMAEMLGAIAGDKVILQGCELNGSTLVRSAGYVFIRDTEGDYPTGEVLHFEGGQGDFMHLVTEDISVTAQQRTYNSAYTVRRLASGLGTKQWAWADFVDLSGRTNRELAEKVAELETNLANMTGEPLGIVKMWAGQNVPTGYALCDGQVLERSDYNSLWAAIGDVFNNAVNADTGQPYGNPGTGKFRLPDLRGRFIVGQNANDTDYDAIGNDGGEKVHRLTAAESGLPAHGHEASTNEAGAHKHTVYFGARESKEDGDHDVPGNDSWSDAHETSTNGAHTHTVTVQQNQAQNASQAHENRPPYYVLAYIMKVLP